MLIYLFTLKIRRKIKLYLVLKWEILKKYLLIFWIKILISQKIDLFINKIH